MKKPQNCHFSFLSCTPSRSIISYSVYADQILRKREGARFGGGQIKVQNPALTPASQEPLALLPPSTVPSSSVSGDTAVSVMSGSAAVLPRQSTASERWMWPRGGSCKKTRHCHPGSCSRRNPPTTLTGPTPRTKLESIATLPSLTHPQPGNQACKSPFIPPTTLPGETRTQLLPRPKPK